MYQRQILTDMVVVKLMGGTGNQMFQYAFGKRLARELHCPLQLDLSFLNSNDHDELYVKRDYSLDIFGIQASFYDYSNPENEDLQPLVERQFGFDPEMIPTKPNVLIEGYWQSEKYFEPIISEIRQNFDLSKLSGVSDDLYRRFLNPEAVCLNVRRGDFVNNQRSNAFHGVLGMEYVKEGITIIEKHLSNPEIYVFSDDVEWCLEHIKLDHPVHVIGHEHSGDRFSLYLHYMSMFRNFIIPNSSFAWWAVWMSKFKNPEQVVVSPKQWFLDDSYCFDDLIPEAWYKI